MRRIVLTAVFILFAAHVYAVDIDSCGELSSAGATYVLQNDVSSNGTCFSFAAHNVVLDLNGHTVTYDNAPPISVQNYGFEDTLLGTWDTSLASNATREPGDYLSKTLYRGSYALRVATPCANQTIQSVDNITLQPNTKYSISGMVYNLVSDDIDISVSLSGTENIAIQEGRTWRGFQYIYKQFTTGSSTESYKINLTVTGAELAPTGTVFFDDIRVQQSGSYGVVSTTSANNPTIKNGSIRQGQARGDFSHAVNLTIGINPPADPGGLIDDLDLYVWGNSCKAIRANYMTNMVVSNNTIDSDVETIAVRDHYDGALIYAAGTSSNGVIANNTILDGIQTGIFARSSSSAGRLEIYGNEISLNSKYTNDFGIVNYDGYGSLIHDNTIDCVSNNGSCRGIYMNSIGGEIYDNAVKVQYKAQNQEYSGCGGAAYGIQLEQNQVNASVHGNTVDAVAGECDAAAFRYFGPASESYLGNNIFQNTFRAIAGAGSTMWASVVYVLQSYSQSMNFTNNTLETNSNWFSTGTNVVSDLGRSTRLDGNTYKLTYPKASFYHPIFSRTYVNGSHHPRNVSLINNVYGDVTAKSDLEESGVYGYAYINGPDTFAYNIVVSGDDPTSDPTCDIDNLNICNESQCDALGKYWYDGVCNTEAEPEEPTTSGPILRTGSHLLRVGDSVLRVQ